MEKLVSSWSTNKTLPENYIFPPDKRPGDHVVPTSKTVPIIDLSDMRLDSTQNTIQKIMQAGKEFGFFQVINHGVSTRLMDETRDVLKQFFELPDEEREIVGDYVVQVKELGSRILELICQGLGLEPGYLAKELSQGQVLTVHYYPPCPDPSLTMGTRKHCDPCLLTILLQGSVSGLQVLKDGEWIGVEANPNAFVVNIGHQLQIVSNGKLVSTEHRAVTNKDEARLTAALFIEPTKDGLVEPAKVADNPAIYKPVMYGEFLKTFRAAYVGEIEDVLEPYIL